MRAEQPDRQSRCACGPSISSQIYPNRRASIVRVAPPSAKPTHRGNTDDARSAPAAGSPSRHPASRAAPSPLPSAPGRVHTPAPPMRRRRNRRAKTVSTGAIERPVAAAFPCAGRALLRQCFTRMPSASAHGGRVKPTEHSQSAAGCLTHARISTCSTCPLF